MESILQTAKNLLLPALREGGTAADFTMGNGHDTLWFSQNLPGGTVWAFDIQPAALEATRRLLTENGAGENVRLILDSHSNLDRYIEGELDAGMFNLGYLPWADKSVTTKQETTLIAVEKALSRLKVGGVLVIVLIEYIPFFMGIGPGADLLFGSTFGGPFMSILIVFVPQVLVFSLLCTYIYRRTGNAYVGAFTVASMAAWIITGGSAML